MLLRDYLKYDLMIEKDMHHLRCFGHVLNLTVQEGIKSIKETLENIRNIAKALKHSSKLKQQLEETATILKQKYVKVKRDNNTR
jgi:hypothetical protein